MPEVRLPLWLFFLLAFLAAVALVERLLVPGLRVVLRRRVRALVEELNARLALRLHPLKLAKKRAVEHMLTHDPEVLSAAERYRQEHGLSWPEVEDILASYAREIVPTFNVYLYYRWGYALARRFLRAIYRVRVAFADKNAFAAVNPEDSVVFLANHRSNVDYLLVAYLVSRHAAVSYAVGEWAKVWPLDTLIRRLGGYFVRRNTADPLYRKVLERYVQLAADAGITQGVFPEGRLTRDGALQPPKLGLLSYLLRRFDPQGPRDLVFIPVGINYDRVFEDRTHVQAREPSLGRGAQEVASWLVRLFWRWLTGRAHRFGYAAVNFGVPVSARALLAQTGELRTLSPEAFRDAVAAIGNTLWKAVAAVVPATPLPVFTQAGLELEEGGRASHAALRRRFGELAQAYASAGLLVPELEPGELYRFALRLALGRSLVHLEGDELVFTEDGKPLLAFYANSIRHHRIGSGA
ncbi:MAG: 1-acyl-sn-glycerol-3-phosphate acyltransferase [Thermoanaerobaculum sp.]